MLIIPQKRKDKITAGPAIPTAWPSITKMPAQIVLPKPIIVACKNPSSLLKLKYSSPAQPHCSRLLCFRGLHRLLLSQLGKRFLLLTFFLSIISTENSKEIEGILSMKYLRIGLVHSIIRKCGGLCLDFGLNSRNLPDPVVKF